ncbi:MAG: endonuclease NucS [Acidimicrobiia bacterium]|nr:endonuclease NucS [Acidimicrobiia bacterium]NNF69375.1 endonuclease NucS [Acidimicrobiia bacterium]
MRIRVAECTVTYEGRLNAYLPEATRLVMVKADGCVAVHADGGAYKPLNWMNAPNQLTEDGDRWIVANSKGERLIIEFGEIHFETAIELGDDPGLRKDAVEAELQRLLAERVEVLGDGLELIRREYPTPVGPVDLLCRDATGGTVAVEIKRRGEIDGVEQLTRYLEFLNRDSRLAPVRGMFVAQEVKPQARTLAGDRGIEWREVDYDELKGLDSAILKLF